MTARSRLSLWNLGLSIAALLLAAALVMGATKPPASPAPSIQLQMIPAPGYAATSEPFLALGPDSVVWLSWVEKPTSGGPSVRAAHLVGSTWTAPIEIMSGDSLFLNSADVPTILPLGEKRMVAYWPWITSEGETYEVQLAQSSNGGHTWSAPVVPHRDFTPTEHGFVSLLPDGQAVRAIWLDGRDFAEFAESTDTLTTAQAEAQALKGKTSVRTAILDPSGSVSGEVVLDPRVCDCCPTAAVTTTSGVLVAYRDRSDQEIRDISLVRLVDGRWTAPYPLHRDGWKIVGCPVSGPALDAEGDHVVAAWYSGAQNSDRVFAAFSDDGGKTFSAPRRVDLGNPIGRLDVAFLADGSAMVAWLESTANHQALLRARRVGRHGALDPPNTIATTSSLQSSGFPRMVRRGADLVFAWTLPGNPGRLQTAVASLK